MFVLVGGKPGWAQEHTTDIGWETVHAPGISSAVIEQATYALMQIAHCHDGAQAVVDAKVPAFLQELLESSNAHIRRTSCRLVGNLAGHIKSFVTKVYKSKLCVKLVSLLRGGQVEVIKEATYALMQIAHWSDGAQAVVDAKVPYFFQELLKSSNAENVALYATSISPAVINRATYALMKIARWHDGAQVLSRTNVLDYMSELLESSDADVRKYSCSLVGNLARHKSIPLTVLGGKLCTHLASRLRDGRVGVIEQATYALMQIAHGRDGAQAVVDANVPVFLQELLESSNAHIRRNSCRLVGNLATHIKSFTPNLSNSQQLCAKLVSLLRDSQVEVIKEATYAWKCIAHSPNGAQAVMDNMEGVLKCSDADVRKWACLLVGVLAGREVFLPTILASKLCGQLVSLLRDEDIGVIEQATYALWSIACWPAGAPAVVEAKVVDYFRVLLESYNANVREGACRLIASIATHEDSARATFDLQLCSWLLLLACGTDSATRPIAVTTLARISGWPGGVAVLADLETDILMDHQVMGDFGSEQFQVDIHTIQDNILTRGRKLTPKNHQASDARRVED
ncbi:armadillo-type protein [Mycena galericulata]|nr:armadillo-type protein [Mycena galericulata]